MRADLAIVSRTGDATAVIVSAIPYRSAGTSVYTQFQGKFSKQIGRARREAKRVLVLEDDGSISSYPSEEAIMRQSEEFMASLR